MNPKLHWGELKGIEANRVLRDMQAGSFLVRRSSFAECDVCCWVSSTGVVNHALVVSEDDIVHLANSKVKFKSLDELIYGYRKTLKIPVYGKGGYLEAQAAGTEPAVAESPSTNLLKQVSAASSNRSRGGSNGSATNVFSSSPSSNNKPSSRTGTPPLANDREAFLQSLQSKPWYSPHGRAHAEALLSEMLVGSFVVRPSSQPRCLSLSHREPGSSVVVGHVLIFMLSSGFRLETETKVHASIEDLLRSQPLRRDLIDPPAVPGPTISSRVVDNDNDDGNNDDNRNRVPVTASALKLIDHSAGSFDQLLESMQTKSTFTTDSEGHPSLPPLPPSASKGTWSVSGGSPPASSSSFFALSAAADRPAAPNSPVSAAVVGGGLLQKQRIRSETGDYGMAPPERLMSTASSSSSGLLRRELLLSQASSVGPAMKPIAMSAEDWMENSDLNFESVQNSPSRSLLSSSAPCLDDQGDESASSRKSARKGSKEAVRQAAAKETAKLVRKAIKESTATANQRRHSLLMRSVSMKRGLALASLGAGGVHEVKGVMCEQCNQRPVVAKVRATRRNRANSTASTASTVSASSSTASSATTSGSDPLVDILTLCSHCLSLEFAADVDADQQQRQQNQQARPQAPPRDAAYRAALATVPEQPTLLGSLSLMPVSVLVNIFSRLGPRAIRSIMCSCQAFLAIVEHYLTTHFPGNPSAAQLPPVFPPAAAAAAAPVSTSNQRSSHHDSRTAPKPTSGSAAGRKRVGSTGQPTQKSAPIATTSAAAAAARRMPVIDGSWRPAGIPAGGRSQFALDLEDQTPVIPTPAWMDITNRPADHKSRSPAPADAMITGPVSLGSTDGNETDDDDYDEGDGNYDDGHGLHRRQHSGRSSASNQTNKSCSSVLRLKSQSAGEYNLERSQSRSRVGSEPAPSAQEQAAEAAAAVAAASEVSATGKATVVAGVRGAAGVDESKNDDWRDFMTLGRARAGKHFTALRQSRERKESRENSPTLNALVSPRGGGQALPRSVPSHIFKILLVGNPSVGKTSFMTRFADGVFEARDSDCRVRTLEIDNERVCLQVYDFATWACISKSYYRAAAGIIVCFAVNDRDSFKAVAGWMQEINRFARPGVALRVVGLKSDLGDEDRRVTAEEASKFCRKLAVGYVETSAKTGAGCSLAFRLITETLLTRIALDPNALGDGPSPAAAVSSGPAVAPAPAAAAAGFTRYDDGGSRAPSPLIKDTTATMEQQLSKSPTRPSIFGKLFGTKGTSRSARPSDDREGDSDKTQKQQVRDDINVKRKSLFLRPHPYKVDKH